MNDRLTSTADDSGGTAGTPDASANGPATGPAQPGDTAGIFGLSVLKGLLLYAAILTFVGLYIYFVVKISAATRKPPHLDATLISAAALLAGVLGSAFALYIGTPTEETQTNPALKQRLDTFRRTKQATKDGRSRPSRVMVVLHAGLSIEPGGTDQPSWPRTIGIWAYAVIGVVVAIAYVLNQNQTPGTVKALAVAFAGYVVALLNNTFRATKEGS